MSHLRCSNTGTGAQTQRLNGACKSKKVKLPSLQFFLRGRSLLQAKDLKLETVSVLVAQLALFNNRAVEQDSFIKVGVGNRQHPSQGPRPSQCSTRKESVLAQWRQEERVPAVTTTCQKRMLVHESRSSEKRTSDQRSFYAQNSEQFTKKNFHTETP